MFFNCAHLADDVHAIANTAIPWDVPAQVDVGRGETSSLQPGIGTIDEAARIRARTGEVEFEPTALLRHRADDFIDLRIVAVMVDVLDLAPLAVRQFRQTYLQLFARTRNALLHRRFNRIGPPTLEQLEHALAAAIERGDLTLNVEGDKRIAHLIANPARRPRARRHAKRFLTGGMQAFLMGVDGLTKIRRDRRHWRVDGLIPTQATSSLEENRSNGRDIRMVDGAEIRVVA